MYSTYWQTGARLDLLPDDEEWRRSICVYFAISFVPLSHVVATTLLTGFLLILENCSTTLDTC